MSRQHGIPTTLAAFDEAAEWPVAGAVVHRAQVELYAYQDSEAVALPTPPKGDPPRGVPPEKWATMNRAERRAWKRGRR